MISVGLFAADSELRRHLREALRAAPDLSRALARLAVGRGGPRDLANLRDGISRRARLARELWRRSRLQGEAADAAQAIIQNVAAVSRLSDRLELLLVDEPPYLARDGGFIRASVHAPLDEVRTLRDESRRVIAGLENHYRQTAQRAAAQDQA